jgi:hypothetical protein
VAGGDGLREKNGGGRYTIRVPAPSSSPARPPVPAPSARRPATWSDRVAALPTLWLAAFALATWTDPRRVGADALRFVVGTYLIEFIVIHSAVLMGVAAFREIPRRARIVTLTALALVYSLMAGGFAAQLHQWWLLVAFWGLMINRFLAGVLSAAPPREERARMLASWGVSTMLYIALAFATVFVPIPALGLAGADLETGGGGLWERYPWRPVAAAAVYFGVLGLITFSGGLRGDPDAAEKWESDAVARFMRSWNKFVASLPPRLARLLGGARAERASGKG